MSSRCSGPLSAVSGHPRTLSGQPVSGLSGHAVRSVRFGPVMRIGVRPGVSSCSYESTAFVLEGVFFVEQWYCMWYYLLWLIG